MKYRETPCKYYICLGECKKGRAAEHKGYCQHCDKYYPRAKVRHIILVNKPSIIITHLHHTPFLKKISLG